MDEKRYSVIGMTCDHCVRSVKAEVGKLPGLVAVDVDLATGRVRVGSDQPLDDTAVEAAVAEAGYAIAS